MSGSCPSHRQRFLSPLQVRPRWRKRWTPDQARFRALYEELVEINTTQSVGDCTEASEALATRLRAGGVAG